MQNKMSKNEKKMPSQYVCKKTYIICKFDELKLQGIK